jgi:acetolactate synthase-1/2/3 large subunit
VSARRHGGQLVARALAAEGVTHLFTLCGGHIQALYDGCIDEGIRVVDTRHEQTAAHAADGWARVTGQPGVAAVTAGPGVTNAVTAVANAQRAQVPMVLLGGQGARTHGPFGGQDRGALQEMDHIALLRSLTKWAVSVPETRRLPEYVQSAFRIARSGVPGPVFVELPLDIVMGSCSEAEAIRYPGHLTEATPAGDPEFIQRAARLLRAAERPIAIVGSQWRWSRCPEGLYSLAGALSLPVFLNGMARGALGRDHPCLFRHCRSAALRRSDCILVFGTPFDFRLGYGQKLSSAARVIQVDLDGAEIGRNRSVDVGIVGDSGRVAAQLADSLDRHEVSADWREELAQLDQARLDEMRRHCNDDVQPINPLRLCSELNQFVGEQTIIVGDGGDFVATAAAIFELHRPAQWMDPGPLGTLGVGPGYALAAKLARPDCDVLLVLGDGSFGFNGIEFEALVRQRIKVVGVVGNDACWTQIHRGQVMLYGRERARATTLAHTRYDRMVEALGGHGEHVRRLDQLRPALERAFAAEDAALVNVEIGASDFRKNALAV